MGAAKQRELLALLLLSPNRTVGRDRLIDELWEGRPPRAAKSTLQAYVYRLRKLLARTGATAVLHGRPGGYLLEVPASALDADRFEQSVAEGRRAWDDGRLADAAAAFRAGLGLWRGAAFADIDLLAVRDRARALEDQRLEATEQCLTAELSVGRHAVAVVELEALVEAHPLRERFWELLILALYRCGRQAEALEAYQRLHRLLDEELGLRPGQSAQDLQQQILAGDPALTAPPVTDGRPAEARVPRQLPAALSGFTGRSGHLAELDKLVHDSGETGLDRPGAVVIIAITGTAGIGKTTLAVHWAHQIAERYTDGQLYVNLRGFDPGSRPMEPGEAVRGFLDALNVTPERTPSGLEAQTGLYRTLLADKRVLVVLDNARDAEQVRPLLPGGRDCLVVVTSRNRMSGLIALDGAHPVNLDLLTVDEARQFLEHRLGPDRVAAEPEAAAAIIASCARLPLALAVVAARAATHPHFPLRALADELRESNGDLDAFDDLEQHMDVRAAYSWSYTRLDPEAARLFRLLGLHPGPDISAAAAASLAGVSLERAQMLLSELTSAHLLAERRPGRYRQHDLLRAYAADLARRIDADADRRAAAHRVSDHYLRTATRLLPPRRPSTTLTSVLAGVCPRPLADLGHVDAAEVRARTGHCTAVR